jgi:hypothetical protein
MTPSSVTSPRDPERLFQLLPAIYRTRDAALGGPLRALLSVLSEQVEHVERDIARMYDNWFIETCEDWVVPYLGELVGYAPVADAGLQAEPHGEEAALRNRFLAPRREVAETVALRRRRGTLAVLELLANDGAGWPARAVELFRGVVVAQHVNFARHRRGVTLVRDADALDRGGGPFDHGTYVVDVRRPASARTHGRPNLPDVALFTWRLGLHRSSAVLARAREEDGDGVFSFSILGHDAPLFIRPQPELEPTHVAGETNVPAPLRRRALAANVRAFYGAGRSFRIWKGAAGDTAPTGENEIDPDKIRVADLTGWYYEPEPNTVVVDPVLGRFAFPMEELPAGDVWVTYHHGFSADMGSGEYHRDLSEPADARIYAVSHGDGNDAISAQLARWESERASHPHAVIEVRDNGFYSETLDVELRHGESLQLRAANGVRPVLNLMERRVARSDPLVIRGTGGRFTLDGFLVVGRGLRIQGELECVTVRHSTLVPGWDITCDCEPCNPNEASITLREFRGRLRVRQSIIGGIHVFDDEVRADPAEIELRDSIVDATDPAHPAVGTQRAGIAHAAVTIVRSTIIGTVWVHAIPLAENSIFLGDVRVARRQIGCMRYCYVAEESRSPRRHRCQPDLVRAAAVAEDTDVEAARVVPRFTSRRYGNPGYGQLADACADEIRAGADDESEMGAFHDLFQPQREAILAQRLAEFVPVGSETAVIHGT